MGFGRWNGAGAQTNCQSELDAVAIQPDARTLDQAGECLAQPFDGIADLSRIDIRRGVLKSPLQDVAFVQQGCLIVVDAAEVLSQECLEDLLGVRAAVSRSRPTNRDPVLALRIST